MGLSRFHFFRFLSIVLVVLVISAITWGLYYLEKGQYAKELRSVSISIHKSIQTEVESTKQLLVSFHAFFSSSDSVEREEFQRFYIQVQERFPSLQAVEWIPKVPHHLREEHENNGQRSFPNFQFTERSENGELVRASVRGVYYPVYYVEPYEGNEAALGYDLSSEPLRREALEKAALKNDFSVTQRIKLVQRRGEEFGFLMYYPLKIDGELKGFVLAVFNINDLFSRAFKRVEQNRLEIFVVDQSAPKEESFLYDSTGKVGHEEVLAKFHFIHPLYFVEREWHIYSYDPRGFFFSMKSVLLISILCLSSIALGYYLMVLEKLVKRRTKEMEREKDRAEEANRAKSRFLSNISHEIRTPLTVILGNTDRLIDQISKDSSESSIYNWLMTIKHSGSHLIELLDDMLNLSKIEAGKIKIQKKEFFLKDIIFQMEDLFAKDAKEKKLEFSIAPVFPVPDRLIGDEKRVRQVLINLCSNALKFTDSGYVKVFIHYDRESQILWFEVSDTGIGIPDEQKMLIFKPFLRSNLTKADEYRGTGLGLSICKSICRLMGGDIFVESQVGKGSIFKVSFYLPTAKDVQYYRNQREIERPLQQEGAAVELNVGGEILIAEDSKTTQEVIIWMLQKIGVRYDVVENGQEAVDYALKHWPELILMDIQMPLVNGLEAVKDLRGRGYDLPVVALTANVFYEDIEKYLEEGFNDYISKPINAFELSQKIKRYLPTKILEKRDDPQLAEIFNIYISRLPKQVASLQEASQEENWEDVMRIVHTIRGSGGHFNDAGLRPILEKAENIEELIRGGGDVSDQINRELSSLYMLITKFYDSSTL